MIGRYMAKAHENDVETEPGRPSLYRNKNHKRTFRLTDAASTAIDDHADRLSTRERKDISASDAVEDLILRGHREVVRAR
jgi:hypothetical protein